LLLGVSRKSFIGLLLGDPDLARRDWPTVALTCLARRRGVRILRVHDVAANRAALRMTEAILDGCGQAAPSAGCRRNL
jgi:dihydropteroate synthase